MALYEMSPERGVGAELPRPVHLICFGLVLAHIVYLATSYLNGSWPVGSGVPPSDFVSVWAAGRLVLADHAAAVYDFTAHKLVEETAVGHPFEAEAYFAWLYPPTFLFAAAALSLLPYATAYASWVFGTFPAYLAAIRAIIGDRTGYLLAAAFPAVLSNFIVGQNGFLSASLFGGTLVLLERRPICAGLLLGLLTYKPHLGLLFPIAIMAGGHWRVFFTAAVFAALMAAASWLAFGSETWQAFFASISFGSKTYLSEGRADWSKLQTAFGFARTLGGSETLAWTVQGILALVAAGAIAALWRSRAAYEIKAAALGTGALLATPYLYVYDLAVLAVPLAFLYRFGRARGFFRHELAGIGLVCLLILIFPFVKAPVGFAAALILAALIARHALEPQSAAMRGQKIV